jgi:hypothetical protein
VALLTPRRARTTIWVGVRILIVCAAVGVAGCASYAQRYAQANEDGLEAAGFEKRLADTPEKLAYVRRLTQRKIVVYQWQGRLYYAWPDARFCKCLYVGNETQFQKYEKLGFEQKVELERRTAAEENEAASLFGPWGPW